MKVCCLPPGCNDNKILDRSSKGLLAVLAAIDYFVQMNTADCALEMQNERFAVQRTGSESAFGMAWHGMAVSS